MSKITGFGMLHVSLIDSKKPTTQLLGRFQPWHDGHTELFKNALSYTGQVAILLRELDKNEDNPYSLEDRIVQINEALKDYIGQYEIYPMPNITHITYGRDVGYTIKEEVLPQNIQDISASKIRKKRKMWRASC